MSAKAANFRMDIAIGIRTNNTQMVLVVNNLNLTAWLKRLLLSLALWLLIKTDKALDYTGRYFEPITDSTERRFFWGIMGIWAKHWLIGAGGELCKI